MKRFTLALFIIGLMLEFVGFRISHMDKIPRLHSVIAPSSAYAFAGYRRLKKELKLLPNDTGLGEFSDFVFTILKEHGTPVYNAYVSEFEYDPARWLVVEEKIFLGVMYFTVVMSNGQKMTIPREFIVEKIQELRSSVVFQWAIGCFLACIFLQILGFVVQYRADQKKDVQNN